MESANANTESSTSDLEMIAKWGGKEYTLRISDSQTVEDLKTQLYSLTNVHPKRQKIVGLFKGKPPTSDETPLRSVPLVSSKKFMMVGTPEENLLKEPSLDELPDVFNDLDYDGLPDPEEINSSMETKRKLTKIIKENEITIMNAPRPGKKLLVLDLDYTIFDMKSPAPIEYQKRPFLDEFLKTVHTKYDIVVWSQTKWTWLEMKLTEMGVLPNPEFGISFVLDRTFMFPITTKTKEGEARTHEVKPLEIIWAKFPGLYSAKNSIHIDDLGRNFALNPQSGLKIKQYKNHTTGPTDDTELLLLSEYLMTIAEMDDFTVLNHDKWKKLVKK